MNVTVHLACGPEPSIQFIVKNYASCLDIRYLDSEGYLLKFINIKEEDTGMMRNLYLDCMIGVSELKPEELLAYPGVVLDGKHYSFSFNTLVTSKTAGGVSFCTGVDICFDHSWGVTINNARKLLTEGSGPEFLSQVLSSCPSPLVPANSVGSVVHADPQFSPENVKKGVAVRYSRVLQEKLNQSASLVVTEPAACEHLLRMAIEDHNLPLVEHLVQEEIRLHATETCGPLPFRFAEIAVNADGCNIHVRSALPQDLQPFTGSYILCMQSPTMALAKSLYYIQPGGVAEEVTIDDWERFRNTFREYRKSFDMSLRLDDEKTNTLITTNGGHIPPGNSNIINSLLEHGVNIHEVNESGNSLLHLAVQKNNEKLVTLLIGNGVNLQQKNNNLDTPVDIARNLGHVKIANLLTKAILNQLKPFDRSSTAQFGL
jgi:hypothetical protein